MAEADPVVDWSVFQQARAELGPGFVRILGYFEEDGEKSVAKIEDPAHDGASLPLPALDPNPPAILHLLPLRGDARDVFSRAHGLVLVNVVDRKLSPSAEMLQGLFDLTPAEARVARIIAEGLGINAASSQLLLSRETVRTQLKAVFAKTGRTSQSSLAALLARL